MPLLISPNLLIILRFIQKMLKNLSHSRNRAAVGGVGGLFEDGGDEGLGSLRKDLDNMVFVAPNGERISFFSDEKKKVIGMFKELGFLFGDNLYVLWESTEEHPRKRKRVLQATEEELEKLIEYFSNK